MLNNSKSTFCEYRKKTPIFLLPFSIAAYCYDLHETYQINGSATGSNYRLPQYRRVLLVTLYSIRIYGTTCSTLFSKTDQLLQNDSQGNTDKGVVTGGGPEIAIKNP